MLDNNACEEGQISCKSGKLTCILQSWICDGEKDCPDGIDESNCSKWNCLEQT